MKVLAPIDGSDCSFRALRFATEFARRFEADLHVVHVTDVETEATDALMDRARKILDEEGIDDHPEVLIEMHTFRPADDEADRIVELVEEEGYDHVVMGNHGAGAVEKLLLGSTSKRVVDDTDVPVSLVP